MPCDSGPSPYYDCVSEDKKIALLESDVNKLTAMLCTSCKLLEKHKFAIPKKVVKWWEHHKKVDAARLKKEKKAKATRAKKKKDKEVKDKQKKVALKKLSSKERKLLGLEK